MNHPYPIYHDADHQYTLTRADKQYAIEMTPIGIGEIKHTIYIDNMDNQSKAIQTLADYARGYRFEKAKRKPRRRGNVGQGARVKHQ